jgi:hypothetical protein
MLESIYIYIYIYINWSNLIRINISSSVLFVQMSTGQSHRLLDFEHVYSIENAVVASGVKDVIPGSLDGYA